MISINELDIRLCVFINVLDNFLDSIGFVNVLYYFMVWVSKEFYVI